MGTQRSGHGRFIGENFKIPESTSKVARRSASSSAENARDGDERPGSYAGQIRGLPRGSALAVVLPRGLKEARVLPRA
jgi:hypothetical protein